MFKLLSSSSILLLLISIHNCHADTNGFSGSICRAWAPVNSSDTAWKENLNNVFNSLATNVVSHGGFYRASAGHDGPDRMYGLIQCRSDISPSNCSNCTQEAFLVASSNCNSSIAAVWLKWCYLRYSNANFFGTWEGSGAGSTTAQRDDPTVAAKGMAMMEEMAGSASNGTLRFATGEIDDGRGRKRYGLAQCTRDLKMSGCRACLDQLLRDYNTLIADKRAWEAHNQGCAMWYDDYEFYFSSNSTISSSSPPPPPPSNGSMVPPLPPPSSSADQRVRGISFRMGITIVLTANGYL